MYRQLTTKHKRNIRTFIKDLEPSDLNELQRRIKANSRNLLETYLMDKSETNLLDLETCQYSNEVISKINQTNNQNTCQL